MTITVHMDSDEFLEFSKFREEKRIDNAEQTAIRRKYYNLCVKIIKAYGAAEFFDFKATNFAELRAAQPELLKEVFTEAYEEWAF